MNFLDSELTLYIILIGAFLIIFLWGRKKGNRKQGDRRNQSFRQRYRERRREDNKE